MKNYLMTLQYDGGRYSGWQRQGNTVNTIENKITDVLNRMSGSEVEIHGSGRTDAGVHAEAQKASFKLETDMPVDEIKEYLNRYLPEDICVTEVCSVDDRFHARLSAKRKVYEYTIDMSSKADVFHRKYSWNVQDILNINQMRMLSELLVGEHDFRGFSDMKKDKKSSIRTIYDIEIIESGNFIKIKYTGNGFLFHMVRKLTAFLVDAGQGNATEQELFKIFEIADKSAYKKLAPPHGLVLKEVIY